MTMLDEARQWFEDGAWHYVSSSNVDAFRYDRSARTLDIQFHGNRRYRYFNIPASMVADLVGAASVGQWFHANLKGAPFERL